MGTAVRADLTVTMHPEAGLVRIPARVCRRGRVADIGIPSRSRGKGNLSVSLLDRGSVQGIIGERRADAHKGLRSSHGRRALRVKTGLRS